jgi:hypothetical protein
VEAARLSETLMLKPRWSLYEDPCI